jgi:K+ transporter
MPREQSGLDENRAPLLGTWRRWYIVVLATLAAIIALFAFLSATYR